MWLPRGAIKFDIFERMSQVRFEGLDLLRSEIHALDARVAFTVVESTATGCESIKEGRIKMTVTVTGTLHAEVPILLSCRVEKSILIKKPSRKDLLLSGSCSVYL